MKTKPNDSTAGNMLYLARCTKVFLPSLLWYTAAAALLKTALPVLEMFTPKLVIDEISRGGSWQTLIAVVLSLTLSLALLSAASKFCERSVYDRKILMGDYYLRLISQKALTTDYANRETDAFRTAQDESYGMCQNNESILRNVYYIWITLLSSVIGCVYYAALLARLNVILLVFLAATTAASYFVGLSVTKWTDQNYPERSKYQHRLGYIAASAENTGSAKDIRLYAMRGWLQTIYDENITNIAKWYRRYDRLVRKTSLSNAGISLLREGAAYAYLIYLAVTDRISAGDFVLYFAAITGFSGWLSNMISGLSDAKRTAMFTNKFRSYLDYPDTFRREGGVSVLDKLAAPSRIELKNVSYRYLGAEDFTLRHIDLTIEPGRHIGIVGLNGAGKTTLVKLICGLIDPTEGEVLYDGVNIKEYDRIAYYRLFSAVFQQYSLLPFTISEIVAETTPDRLDEEKVRRSLETAGLWEKVASLPKGTCTSYDQAINEDAVQFSGGETQKLLLARAVYKDAPVLVLDEPTAALDPLSENRLYETYHGITHGKTSLFISHRLASTRFCDTIILISNGAIAEQGTHEELLQEKGLYYSLFETQAQYYREHGTEEAANEEA